MNAIPAEAHTDTGQDQQNQEQGSLAVVGGRGRPSAEQMEATRKETVTKLRALGIYDQAVEHAGLKGWGKPEKWNTRTCNAMIAWAREQAGVTLCECGEPAHHYLEDENEETVALCNACNEARLRDCNLSECEVCGEDGVRVVDGAMLCQGCYRDYLDSQCELVPPGEGPWVDDTILFGIFHSVHELWDLDFNSPNTWDSMQVVHAWDGFRGILGAFRLLHAALKGEEARYRAYVKATNRIIRDLEKELAESFGDIQRLTSDREYKASLKDILVVAGIDRGRFVRDLKKKLQQVLNDAVGRDDPGYKGKVKAILTLTFDKSQGRPTESLAAIITCEVNEDTPPAVSGSRLHFDAKGEILPPKDALEQMPLVKAGNDSQARA